MLRWFTYITWQEGKNARQYSDSLSSVCAQLITKTIQLSSLPTGDVVDIEFSDDMAYQSALTSLRSINAKKAGEAAAAGVAVGVLTAVVDSSTGRIVFYNTDAFEDGNPTREEHIRKIIELLFNDFGKQKSVSSRH